jgi:apolipoprotein N-acyltransferase
LRLTEASPPGALTAGIAAVASGLLVAAAFPPFGLWPLAFVGLVPLLWVWRGAGPGRGAWTGLVAGSMCFTVLLSWTWYFGAVAIVPLVLVQALYWAAAGLVVGALGRTGVRSPFIVAAAWTLAEAARGAWPLGGLAWGEIGTSLAPFGPARALAPGGGVLLVSFAVVAIQAGLADLAHPTARGERGSDARRAAALTLLGVTVAVTVAVLARPGTTAAGSIRIATLQANDLDRRLTPSEIADDILTRKHLDLAETLRGPYDLIVFPESALMSDPETDPVLRAEIVDVGRRHDAYVLVNVIERGPRDLVRNTDRLYAPDGRLVGRYSKRHLVPFGEYVPWRDRLGFIGAIDQVPEDMTPGRDGSVLRIGGGVRIGALICFESVFGPLVRDTVRDGAEILVVSTNNRSYRRSGNSAQHVQSGQMRAAETGRAVVQAAISGISAVIDPHGVVTERTQLFERTTMSARVPVRTGETPYVRWGAWILPVSIVILGSAGALGWRRRRLRGPAGGTDEGVDDGG